MSKKLFSFMVGELMVVRLICKSKKCGVITEVSADKLHSISRLQCPNCNEDFARDNNDPIVKLGAVLRQLREDSRVGVEFVLPVED